MHGQFVILLAAFAVTLPRANAGEDEKSKALATAILDYLSRNGQLVWPKNGYSLFVKGVEGQRLVSPTFKVRDETGDTSEVAIARSAEIKVDWRRSRATLILHDGEYITRVNESLSFTRRGYTLPLPDLKQE
jgi:hypothetical protein